MEQYYYAPSTQGFYCKSVHGENIPNEVIPIDVSLYKMLLDGQSQGLLILPPDETHDNPYLGESQSISLEEAKMQKLQTIIFETEAAILAGFEYRVDGNILHFSYQYNDQQNYSDTANMATFSKMGVAGVPTIVTWNGWEIEKDAQGNEISRTLVQLELSTDAFLALYMQGALAHKARQMAIGSERKANVELAATIEELEAI